MAFTDAGAGRKIVSDNRVLSGGITVTLAGTVKIGDPIGYSSGWKRADADAPIPARYIACQDGVSGDVIEVCTEAVITGVTTSTGITGASVGAKVYTAATAGLWTETVITGSGNDATPYGSSLDANTIHVRTHPGTAGNVVL